MISTKVQKAKEILTTKQLDQREPEKRGELTKQLLFFPFKDDPSRFVQIKALLPEGMELTTRVSLTKTQISSFSQLPTYSEFLSRSLPIS